MDKAISPPVRMDDTADSEAVYLQATFAEDRHTLKLSIVCFFVLNIFLALTESLVIINEPYFGAIMAMRIVTAVTIVGLAIWFKQIQSSRSLEVMKVACVVLLCGTTAVLNLLYGTPAILDMVLILVVYTILPGSQRITIAGTLVLSAVSIYLLVPLTDNPYNVDLLAGNFMSHLLGLVLGSSQRRRRRELFWAAKHDRELRINLEEALSEVNRLSGLLPICCVCKKIRDDEGQWVRLESYVRQNSDADFSHGYCPCCFEETIQEIGQQKPA